MVDGLWRLRFSLADGDHDLAVGPGDHVLGSAPDADLQAAHPTVSRRHARISCTPSAVTIEDLGSTNGTKVNGSTVTEPVTVEGSASIDCGDLHLMLQPDSVGRSVTPPHDSQISSGASLLLGDATVGFLRGAGEEASFAAGDVVVRRGEQQDVFYVVISGEAELVLKEGESRGRPIARLGEGAIFGAESVLGKSGAAVDAVAVSDLRVLRYPASELPTALQESASLRRKLLGGIARRLNEATADALDLLKGTEVIARLVQGDHDPVGLVAESPRMRQVKKTVDRCATQDGPVLVVGEDGTGKTLVARLIHDGSPRAQGPLIAVNCRDLTAGTAGELILGEDLGGRLPTSSHGSGGIHLAHGGTLVLRGADQLEASVQKLLASHFATEANRPRRAYPDTRIILTARTASSNRGDAGTLVPELVDHAQEVIQVPSLVDRPKDILPLAYQCLERHGPAAPVITEEARHALLSLRYQRRNAAELREIVDLAVRVADGPEIRAEHIFGGVGEDVIPGIDITKTSFVHHLRSTYGIRALRWSALAGFIAVIGVCLASAASVWGRVGNTAIWSIWEPVVFAFFLLAGPIWCTICPLSTAARLTKRLRKGTGRPPPVWMKRHGPWMAIVGFFFIVWIERVFRSTENPIASGALLAGLILSAVVFALVYRREVWCRYLCPLGRLATALAPACPLQITARQSICASTCTTHACFKGTTERPGCTVFHHPLEAKQSHRCKLCLDCLDNCPHGSTRLQLRSPLVGLWRLDASATDISMFAVAVSLLALALIAQRAFEGLSDPLRFTALCLIAIVAGIALHAAVIRCAPSDRHKETAIRLAAAVMVVGWSALMTGQLANIPALADARIVLPSYDWMPAWVVSSVSLLVTTQVVFVVLGTVLALICLSQIRSRATSGRSTLRWAAAYLVVLSYVIAVSVLLVLEHGRI